MFDVIYTDKVSVGSAVIERKNKVSVSQDYLENLGQINYFEVACTGATSDGFCVYIKENPESSMKRYKSNNIKHKIISRHCGNKSDDEKKYTDTLECVHYLAKAINKAYVNGEDQFNVNDWLVENHYA